MRSAFFRDYGGVDVLEVGELPSPVPELRKMRVVVRAASVNPKDVLVRKGKFRFFSGTEFPQGTGYDFAGEVADVALAPSAGFAPGDRVFGMVNGMAGRTCAEEVIVAPAETARMPENLSFEEAAALPLVSLTALQALRDLGRLQQGQHVCINGASGGVGSVAVQIARILGAEVTAVASAKNHDLLRDLGAGHCVDYRKADVTAGDRPRFHVFFDVFGNRPFRQVKPVLHPRGRWISTVPRGHVFRSVLASTFLPGKKARLVLVKSKREDLDLLRSWIESRHLRPLIQQIFPLEEVRNAHRQVETKHSVGKVVIRIGGDSSPPLGV